MLDAHRPSMPLPDDLEGLRRFAAQSGSGALRALLDGLGAMGIGVDIVGADYVVQYQNSVLAARFPDAVGRTCYGVYCTVTSPASPARFRRRSHEARGRGRSLRAATGALT